MTMTTSTSSRRLALIGSVAGTAVLIAAVPAFAHVGVQPASAAKGSYGTVAFKVPNERDNASTVKVEVDLPADHPISSVSTEPVAGWKIDVTRAKLATPLSVHGAQVTEAVTKIVWSGGQIAPGQFQRFPVSLGPLPDDTGRLVFKALQTYSDNEVVRWIEEQKPGAPEPENPAPALILTTAADGTHDGAGTTTHDDAMDTNVKSGTANAASSSDTDSTARILGVVGILVGVVGIAFGAFAGRRRTSTSA